MDQLPVSFADIAVILVILISAALAFVRGFVREVLAIAAWVGAIAVTVYTFSYARPYTQQYIEMQLIADAVTGLGIFIVALVVFTIVSHTLSRNVRNSGLGAVDRSLGLLFGMVRGAALICAAYLAMMWAIPKPEDRPLWVQNAKSQPMVESGAEFIASLLPAEIIQSGEEAASSVTDRAEELIDAGEAVESLTGDGAGSRQDTTDSTDDSDDAEAGRSGYNDAERNQMDRVIQSTE
jgi:membrane protein required for colicin V production